MRDLSAALAAPLILTAGILTAGILAAGSLLASSGCVVREVRHCPGPYPECRDIERQRHPGVAVGPQQQISASTYPPDALSEAPGAQPDEDSVWVEGNWHWNGVEWVWVGGRWLENPGDDYVYVEPSYEYYDDGCAYVPGYWDLAGSYGPSVVIVRDHYRPPIVRNPTRPPVRDYRTGSNHTRPPVRDNRSPTGKPPHGSPRPSGDRPSIADQAKNPSTFTPAASRPTIDNPGASGRPTFEPGPTRPHQEPRQPTAAGIRDSNSRVSAPTRRGNARFNDNRSRRVQPSGSNARLNNDRGRRVQPSGSNARLNNDRGRRVQPSGSNARLNNDRGRRVQPSSSNARLNNNRSRRVQPSGSNARLNNNRGRRVQPSRSNARLNGQSRRRPPNNRKNLRGRDAARGVAPRTRPRAGASRPAQRSRRAKPAAGAKPARRAKPAAKAARAKPAAKAKPARRAAPKSRRR